MLDVIFFTKNGQTANVSMDEEAYKQLAKAGLSKVVTYADYEVIVEGEEYEIYAAKLSFENRKRLVEMLETERQRELEELFKNMDDKPTIKEMRGSLSYVKVLTEMYQLFVDDENAFFSYA